MEKKLAVEDCYENKNQLCGGQPNLMEIARAHKVSKKFVRKIEGELYKHDGRVIYLEEITLVGDGMVVFAVVFVVVVVVRSVVSSPSPSANSPCDCRHHWLF